MRLMLYREPVYLLAVLLAGLASDAALDIDENRFFVRHRPPLLFVDLGYDRKNSWMSLRCDSGSRCDMIPLTGRPPSCAIAGIICCAIAVTRLTLFCSHGPTSGPCTRFFTLVAISGDLTMQIQPLR